MVMNHVMATDVCRVVIPFQSETAIKNNTIDKRVSLKSIL